MFLASAAWIAAGGAMFPGLSFAGVADIHQRICKSIFRYSAEAGLEGERIGTVIMAVAGKFAGAPYQAQTLEASGSERLIVNLEVFDCVTLVESVLALSRCIQIGDRSFSGFQKELALIRYRGGVIDGYPSRLHYFSDWIDDNESKNIVRNVTKDLGGIPFDKRIDFMTRNRSRYGQLACDSVYAGMRSFETSINNRDRTYIPKTMIGSVEQALEPGDILAFTTSVRGLDIQHTGFTAEISGKKYLLHAPNPGENVGLTDVTVGEYMERLQSVTGVMVARPLDTSQSDGS
jgi:hypothetical protein